MSALYVICLRNNCWHHPAIDLFMLLLFLGYCANLSEELPKAESEIGDASRCIDIQRIIISFRTLKRTITVGIMI